MRSERSDALAAEQAATELALDEILALRPHRLRGPFPPGGRGPGGERAGRGHARSLNFETISPYQPGDDVRWIDWRATARSGEAQMRRFAAASHRARIIVLDLRPDLYFGMRERLMAKTAALAAAKLAWEAAELHEPVALIAPGAPVMRPRSGKKRLIALLEAIRLAYRDGATPGPRPPRAALLASAGALAGRRDEVHVVSDFEMAEAEEARIAADLATRIALTAWIVEDRALAAPAPAGRYPMIDKAGARLTAAIGRPGGAPEAAARRRAALRSRLREAGWTARAALDILPAIRPT
ncbi:MAG: DUF58 domain-containing protein [Paracoccaceae bacterium]